MNALSGAIEPLCVLLLVAFLALGGWAFLLSRRPGARGSSDLPAAFITTTNAVHGLYALTLLAGLLAGGGTSGLGKFLEYILVFTGGGVVYSRGVLPKGWVWRILNDPPNAAWGVALGSGWCAAAVLGFVFFLSGGK